MLAESSNMSFRLLVMSSTVISDPEFKISFIFLPTLLETKVGSPPEPQVPIQNITIVKVVIMYWLNSWFV